MSMEKVREIIEGSRCGYVATSVDGQPRVRPMLFVLMDDGSMWSSTYNVSGKVKEFEQNQRVEVCFTDSKWVQLRVTGNIDLSGGPDKKKKLLELNPKVRNHFPDENDPKFVHVELRPSRLRWKPAGFSEYNEIE
jgi:uncharacterized pyridoxamine 5'-phosphate oxidase family protein